MKQSNQNKDETLESKVKKTRLRSFITSGMGLVAAGMITFLGYNNWRNQPVFHDDLNAVAPRSFNLESITEANQFLLDFPAEIPGASSVDKYITPGARYTLVHIRQTHMVENPTQEVERKIESSQRDIYKILEYLVNNIGFTRIYKEGVAELTEGVITSTIAYERIFKSIFEIDLTRINQRIIETKQEIELANQGEIPEEYYTISSNIEQIRTTYLASLHRQLEALKDEAEKVKESTELYVANNIGEEYKYNAVGHIAINYLISIESAEEAGLNIEAGQARERIRRGGLNPKERDRLWEIVLEDREDVLLSIISNQINAYAIAVYGAAHAWGGNQSFGRDYPTQERLSMKDNIAEWNKINPNKKFSLIEITPKSHIERKY
ncbi:MAG: hypothetical protein ACMXYG_06175 [Candidatus Woesearchaeota archaeon]